MKNYIRFSIIFCFLSISLIKAAEVNNERALVVASPLEDADQKRSGAEKEERDPTGLLINTLAGERDKELSHIHPNENLENIVFTECRRLVANNADVNYQGPIGTPLILAVRNSHGVCGRVLPLLLSQGADDTFVVDNRSFHDHISLYREKVVQYQKFLSEKIVPLLKTTKLPQDCVLLIANKMGMTEQDMDLHTAVRNHEYDKIRELLGIGVQLRTIKADPNVSSGSVIISQRTALRYAWRNEDFESFDLLLTAGANPDKNDGWSSKSILRALGEDTLQNRKTYLERFLPRLLQAGADVNQHTFDYIEKPNGMLERVVMPVFTYAVKKCGDDKDFIVTLLKYGNPDLSQKDAKGKTALDYAQHNPEILQLLQQRKAHQQSEINQALSSALVPHLRKIVVEYL